MVARVAAARLRLRARRSTGLPRALLDGLGGANIRTRESSLEKMGSARMAIEAGRPEGCRWRRARVELEGR